MQKYFLLLIMISSSPNLFCADKDTTIVLVRKLDYNDFIAKYSVNDTSTTIINIFFDKRNNSAKGQMSIFPITAAIFPLVPILSVGMSVVSFPFFVNGSVLLYRYRKSKLQKVLINYKENRTMPNWVRKKVNKSLDYGRFDEE